jgi:hypothetical protein
MKDLVLFTNADLSSKGNASSKQLRRGSVRSAPEQNALPNGYKLFQEATYVKEGAYTYFDEVYVSG